MRIILPAPEQRDCTGIIEALEVFLAAVWQSLPVMLSLCVVRQQRLVLAGQNTSQLCICFQFNVIHAGMLVGVGWFRLGSHPLRALAWSWHSVSSLHRATLEKLDECTLN